MGNDTYLKKYLRRPINKEEILYPLSNIRVRRQFREVYTHVDKIRINCYQKDRYEIPENEFFNSLRSLWFRFCNSKLSLRDRSYQLIRMYQNLKTGEQLIILHRPLGDKNKPPMQINLHDPKMGTIQRLNALCNSLNIRTIFSQIELAMDYPYDCQLHEFFIEHLFVKNNRGTPRFIGKKGTFPRDDFRRRTYYSGQKNRYRNKPKNCKTTSLYRKNTANGMILRLELILNRVKNKEFGLDTQLENINTLDISKLFCFKTMDWKAFYKHIENRFLKYRDLSKESIAMSCLFIRDVLHRRLNDPGLMPLCSHLKKEKRLTQPSRFFIDMPEINKEFFGVLENKRFLS